MRVRYSRRAIADLIAIADYIRERNAAGAAKVETSINDAIELLAEFPELGRERPELGVRALVVPRFAYTAFYRLEGPSVWIIHIRDGRRRPIAAEEI